MARQLVLITYEGQPTTCFRCNEIGHLYQVCHNRRRAAAVDARASRKSWAEMVITRAAEPLDKMEGTDRGFMWRGWKPRYQTSQWAPTPKPKSGLTHYTVCGGPDG